MNILYVAIEIIALSILSKRIIQSLYNAICIVFRSRTIGVTIVTAMLFPGTVIHELAHLFTAEILGVHTGKITLAPESIREDEIQSGSVAIAQTDPLRRMLIGIAPMLFGLILLTAIAYLLSTFPNPFTLQGNVFTQPVLYQILGLGYVLFVVSLSMFPSSVDLKGTPALLITLSLFIIGAYIVGIRINLTGQIQQGIDTIFGTLHRSLILVLAINTILLLTTHVLIDVLGKLTHRSIRH